jgi:DNA-binding transcriptional LysR family regulator
MDIKALEHFVAACHHGNLTAAAAELGVTQPALSKSIKRLEASLGVRLVERGRFGVRATPMGDKLVVRARLIAAQLASVEQDVAALRGKHRTEVVLGCGPTEATRLLPRAAAELARVRPEL